MGRRGVTTALEQINTYRSIMGSEMGDPVPTQQLPMTMDEVVPPTTAVAFKDRFFKRPLPPGPKPPIDRPTPGAVTKPMPRQSRAVSPSMSVASSVRAGESAAEVSQRARAESVSPGAGSQPWDQHASRDKTKKVTLATKAVGRGMSPASSGGNDDWPRASAIPPVKKTGRGGFDAPTGPGMGGLGPGPSHAGLRPPQVGQKRPAQLSKSLMKVMPKIQRQVNVQHQLSQEDLQPPLARVYLPSAPMGAPRAPETSTWSQALATAERELLEQEARASDDLYMILADNRGKVRVMLQQPVQPTGRTGEPVVP